MLIRATERQHVSKPWGWEGWIFNNKAANLCMKELVMAPGQTGSAVHYHPVKDEVLLVTEGVLEVDVYSDRETLATHTLHHGDAIFLEHMVPHLLRAVSMVRMIEASTHHSDDDVVRWEDS